MTTLLSSIQSDILILTFNRPDRANAFNLEVIGELQDALRRAASDAQVRTVVLTGAGKAFGAGQDIEGMRDAAGKISYREHLRKTYNPLILQIRQIEKPVIAAVNGMCAGASLGIALACDLRLASAEARFVVGFTRIGLAPDSAVSLLLPALIGLGRASEFTFTNEPISARQALEWGLVNRVHPHEDLINETMILAGQLSAGAVGAFGLAKRAFNAAILSDLEGVLDGEADLQEVAGRGEEHKRNLAVFLENRAPK